MKDSIYTLDVLGRTLYKTDTAMHVVLGLTGRSFVKVAAAGKACTSHDSFMVLRSLDLTTEISRC